MNKFRLAVKGFIVRDNTVLILKRAQDDAMMPEIWEIPGGRLRPSEDPRIGLKREIMEETGIEVEVGQPLNVRHFTRSDKQVVTMIIFLCSATESHVQLSEEHSTFRWVPIEECEGVLSEFYNPELEIYTKFFRNAP